jgi:hypothetical protein
MPTALLFEIWNDPKFHSDGMSMVTRDGDSLRASMSPDAVLIHSFTAISNFDAFQKSHDFHGWGRWQPEPDWQERYFTEDERLVQAAYLKERAGI